MESLLCKYMTIQVEQLQDVLANFQEEQSAILDNDRRHMQDVLDKRKVLVDTIHQWSEKIGRALQSMALSGTDHAADFRVRQLNREIERLMQEIETRNDRNKALLQIRVLDK